MRPREKKNNANTNLGGSPRNFGVDNNGRTAVYTGQEHQDPDRAYQNRVSVSNRETLLYDLAPSKMENLHAR